MASKVKIANRALSAVGGSTITSFEDQTRSSNLVELHYDQVVDDVLASNNWTVSTFRTSLSLASEAPAYGFANKFPLPTDPYCLKVIDSSLDDFNFIYKIEGRNLLTDEANVDIRYTGRLTDAEAFGPNVTKCVISLLAQRLAYDLTGPGDRYNALVDQYDFVWADASANDGQQGSPGVIVADDLIDVRL